MFVKSWWIFLSTSKKAINFDKIKFLGALDDFDAGNQTKNTDKDIDSGENNTSAEVWNEEFVAWVSWDNLSAKWNEE